MNLSTGRGPARVVLAVCLAVVVIPATVYFAATIPRFTLNSALLVLLLEVVVIAALSNVYVAVITAVAAVGLANWFLVQPRHTFQIGNADDVVALAVFVFVAVGASVVVTSASRSRQAASRAASEASVLRTSVAEPVEESDPLVVLERVRALFDLYRLELVSPVGAVIAAVPPSDAASLEPQNARYGNPSSAAGRHDVGAALPGGYLLRGDGPTTLGLDQPMLASLGAAALRSWQSRELVTDAARAQELAAMDRARSALLASVGHDLRTPITAIAVAAATLRSDVPVPAEDRAELIGTIAESAQRLDELVANLLDMSRLEAGQLIAHVQPVDVEEVLAEAALAGSASRIEVHAASPCRVLADSGLLDRVLANLVTNAMRHSPPDARVVLTAKRAGDRVMVRVIDHGPGLSRAAADNLFRPFRQDADRSGEGVGLGLAIAHGFVEAMGGTIRAESTPGGGVTMVVDLAAAL